METSNSGIYVAKKTHFSWIPEIHGDGSASNILGKFRTTGFARSCTTRIRKGGGGNAHVHSAIRTRRIAVAVEKRGRVRSLENAKG